MRSARTSLLSSVSLRSVAIVGMAAASLTVLSACSSGGGYSSNAQPTAAAACNPCNPCAAAACNPCTPCAAAACNPCNPCAAINPCAAAERPVAAGLFYDGPHAPGHQVSGNAEIVQAADGSFWLHLTDFRSDRGPDVNIILSPADTPKTDAAVKQAGYVTIAARKRMTGDQSYALPGDLDLSAYKSVGVWCEEFGVLFGAAALRQL